MNLSKIIGDPEVMAELAKCELCGEPIPPGEEMFRFHGYSGSCPKQSLSWITAEDEITHLKKRLSDECNKNQKLQLENDNLRNKLNKDWERC